MPQEGKTRDLTVLIRDKYGGDATKVTDEDRERLTRGEPLAYIIGDIPFCGLSLLLRTRPLIPRPETEWWTEKLIDHINKKFGSIYGTETSDAPSSIYGTIDETKNSARGAEHISPPRIRVLDLCAGSGAIGLSVLSHCPQTHVSFGELSHEHCTLILENTRRNNLDTSRADVRVGDLFAPFVGERFDFIAANPPYIPEHRQLPKSVDDYEPHEALFGGRDGLSVIQRICKDARDHLQEGGELWMECDVSNIGETEKLAQEGGAKRTEIHNDQHGRPRLLVGYY